ncbi:TM0106 family RecB-like putative nuclease [Skermanella sp. TT6]|uniref:TM0106 family RecB-like putative nuclease n=1 Tax=Skermanella cutis TaxID=2775420 RepID=A0ABX7BBN6_9PROT|nr:TM0106 family RecB-like putative nuclease [Skermanella sp. TT6]QQP89852.1 TM0106 family RecB-like putative nuclease [Skermanella sp. TT6]
MRRYRGNILLSAGDLVTFVGCRHASALDRRALDEDLERTADDAALRLLQERGIEHERAFRDDLVRRGLRVVEIPAGPDLAERVRLTLAALRSGADVVYQGALLDGGWHGFADFLIRTDDGVAGGYGYEVADTKLARTAKPRHVVQLAVYTELLARVAGATPRLMRVRLGSGEEAVVPFLDVAAYVRHARARLEDFLSGGTPAGTTAEPCAQCDVCHWRGTCLDAWDGADHLSLVANIRRTQIRRLSAAGIGTVAALAALPETAAVPGMTEEALRRLRSQAALQVSVRGRDDRRWEPLPAGPGRGFGRLPAPTAHDLFFDMEGDPLYPGGLEYLFGVQAGDTATGRFHAFWGHDRAGEKRAFEAFMDFAEDHLARHPDAFIYHYNHYEVTALKRLAMSHGSREAALDGMLRRHRFVDLYAVVREAIRTSEPGYSLKNIERFYLGPRGGDVANAADSIVAYEEWRRGGDDSLLRRIEDYNAVDCRSTAGLRDWLVSIRPAGLGWFDAEPDGADAAALERQRAAEAERQALDALLLGGAPDGELPVRRLIADLAEFHRRAQKPDWWALFDRQTRAEDELVDDAECLGALILDGRPAPAGRSLLYTYRFPPQDTKLRAGAKPTVAATGRPAGTIESLDLRGGTVVIRRGTRQEPLPSDLCLGPPLPVEDTVLRAAIRRFAGSVAAGDGRFAALEAILRREPPRLAGRAPGAPVVAAGSGLLEGSVAAIAALDGSYLVVQGPPGTGKTYTASHAILDLLRRGRRVGVSSNSHKAINNLLAAVERLAADTGFTFRGVKKSAPDDGSALNGRLIEDVFNNAEVDDAIDAGARLVAGTAWLLARPELEGRIDTLFVDEAGQVSLANLVAMGTSASNIVLVGDQMQLSQPVQGTHPGGSGAGVLEHLLGGRATVPPDRGVFLDASHRMHPAVCGWVSETIYDGRLNAAPGTAFQVLELGPGAHPALAPAGVRFVPAAHEGRTQRSPEEAELVRSVWTSLMGQRYRDRHGRIHAFGPDNVLVVAPYNVQVNHLAEILPSGARVGTVDRFQGQEAEVVIVSMTTSSGDDLPRDIEFLFSRNRLNVALSRARSLAVVVASPRLLEVQCATIEQMRLVNTLCRAYEWSLGLDPAQARRRAALPDPLRGEALAAAG